MGGGTGMGVGKLTLVLIGVYAVTYIITTIVLRSNRKQYNIQHYYPQNAINL